ncbi:MAG: hypothetical protein Q8P67_28365 [archaeon]|nr:hypothetical protein [archaeon]
MAAPVGLAPWKLSADTMVRKALASLVWDLGVTPQGLLRSLGSYGRRLWGDLGERSRYRGLDAACWEYLGHAQMLPGSGDVAFMRLLTRSGWGDPLLESLSSVTAPTRIIYGEDDYVRHEFGPIAVHALSSSPGADHVVIPDVGHHLYWDQHQAFSDHIISFHRHLQNS